MLDQRHTRRRDKYDETTPVLAPIEIRFKDGSMGNAYVLSAWVTHHGTVSHSLTLAAGGPPNAIENLMGMRTGPAYPRKAVPGWQAEMIAYAEAGLYEIDEIR